MGREFTISTGMKLFYGALSAGLLIFSLILFDTSKAHIDFVAFSFSVLMWAGAILIVWNLLKRKIVVYDDSILFINLFSTNEINIADIKGYRINDKAVSLEYSSTDAKTTIRSYNDLGDNDELVKWIKDSFKDLDAIDLEKEKDDILHDPSLGFTEQDREDKLKRAKWVAITYNIAGPVIAVGSLVMENKLTVAIVLVYPLIAILVMKLSDGLIKFLSNTKRSVYPSIMIGVMFPSLFLFYGFIDNNILNTDNLWLPLLSITGIVFTLFILTGLNKSGGSIVGQIIVMAVIALFYGVGSIMKINCVYDNSPVKVYHAKVYDKRVSHGKHTSYYLTLSEWGPQNKVEEVNVFKGRYDYTLVGDTVGVTFKKGYLNIPWFAITNK